jgi:hypothetical protein
LIFFRGFRLLILINILFYILIDINLLMHVIVLLWSCLYRLNLITLLQLNFIFLPFLILQWFSIVINALWVVTIFIGS